MMDNLIVFYFAIGFIYCIVNGWIRKLDTDGDYLLPMAWLLCWPPFIVALIIDKVSKLWKKK